MENFINMGPSLWFGGSMWVALAAFVLGLLFLVGGYIYENLDRYYSDAETFLYIIGIALWLFSALALISGAIAAFPYSDARYYSVMRVDGTVTSVSNVFTEGSSDGVTRVPVLTLDTVPDFAMVVEDPRAVDLLNKDVTLSCEFYWNYQAIDTVECKIYKIGK